MFIKKQLDSAILIGHSFGGAIVQLFLEQFPEKVEKMVLISSIPPTGMLFDMGHFALRHPWKFLKLGTINFRKNIHSINDVGSLFLSNKISLTKRKEYCEKIQKDSIRTNITTLKPIVSKNFNPIMSVAGPVTNVFYPSVVAIPNGIVMMLLLAKVPKKGVFTIYAAIQAILFLLVGAFWFIPIGLIIGGVICDFLVMSRNEITMKSMMAAYALFSAIFAFSAICPIKFLQSAFVGAMEKNNIAPEYIQGMLSITSVPMLVVIVAAGLVGGLIGGFIGQKALKKHFIKAGLVSVK